MTRTELWSRLARKGTNPEKIADLVPRQRALLPAALEGLDAAEAQVKFVCAEVLAFVGREANNYRKATRKKAVAFLNRRDRPAG